MSYCCEELTCSDTFAFVVALRFDRCPSTCLLLSFPSVIHSYVCPVILQWHHVDGSIQVYGVIDIHVQREGILFCHVTRSQSRATSIFCFVKPRVDRAYSMLGIGTFLVCCPQAKASVCV